MSPEWISAIADGVLGASAFAVFYGLRRDRLLKRKELMRQFSEGFSATPGAHNAILMLCDSAREVPLWDAADPKEQYQWVRWEDVEVALFPPSSGLIRQEPRYTAIRDSFNDLLGRFASLEVLAKDGLITQEDADEALRRWFYIIGSLDKDKPHIRNLRMFIAEHNLRTTKQLFLRFGVDIDALYLEDLKSFNESAKPEPDPEA